MMMSVDEKTFVDIPVPGIEGIGDPWADWKPFWTGRRKTPHDIQEKHSPTESVTVKISSERKAYKGQRRMVDAKLWEQMTPVQQDAALEIALAHDMMGRGMGYVISNWERIPGAKGQNNVADMHARLINTYVNWARECTKIKISHSIIMDVLSWGFSCNALDRERRMRKGSTRANLLAGLSLYCRLKGWPE